MLQPWLIGAAVVMSALLVPYAGVAQESEPLKAMIVVLRENVRFEDFRAAFRADERAQANPEAWNYLDQGVAGAVQTLEARLGFRAHHVYSAALRGFAAQLTAAQISALERDPLVAYLEPDGVMRAFAQTLPWGIDRIDTDLSSTKAGDGMGAVSNVAVIIIDSGIDRSQVDLNVAAHVVVDGLINWDCNSHGTHVSGTAAAIDNDVDVVGAAPGAPLIGIKVLNCRGSGATSTVIKGVDLVTANAPKPAVVNMSLGGQVSDALDQAIVNSVNGGFFYAVAAGNESQDACNVSPARLGAATDGVMTVAATDQNNQEAGFSNFGNCVDIWAPGVDILSTKLLGGTKTLSGTSMASPHVAGTAALYLSSNPSATPAEIEAAIKANAVSTGTTSKDGRAISLLSARNF